MHSMCRDSDLLDKRGKAAGARLKYHKAGSGMFRH